MVRDLADLRVGEDGRVEPRATCGRSRSRVLRVEREANRDLCARPDARPCGTGTSYSEECERCDTAGVATVLPLPTATIVRPRISEIQDANCWPPSGRDRAVTDEGDSAGPVYGVPVPSPYRGRWVAGSASPPRTGGRVVTRHGWLLRGRPCRAAGASAPAHSRTSERRHTRPAGRR
jgi:hypothetical protein